MKSILIILLLSTITIVVQGQSLYNQGSLITISSNTTILVPDSIINNGEITNNGDLIVQGTWINNNVYNSGTGSITLASASPQFINHNDQSLTQLTISGGGDKIFEQDIIVEDQLVMDDGLLISSNGARIIVNDGALITGASEVSYIVGEVINIGTGLKYFPVGTTDAFLPLELLDVQGSSPQIGATASADNINLTTVGTLDEVSARWFWELEIVTGEFVGSPIRLAVNQESLGGEITQFVVAEAINANNPFRTLGQSDFGGDTFDGYATSSLNAVGGFYAVGLDLSITEERPALSIFNAVTPNGDNRHEFLRIENIEFYPNNQVVIYDKTGRKVYEVEGYNNVEKVFSGYGTFNDGDLLPEGTYYYLIKKNDGSESNSGYFVLTK